MSKGILSKVSFEEEYRQYLLTKEFTPRKTNYYLQPMRSSVVKRITAQHTGQENVFFVKDLETLDLIYIDVKFDDDNNRLHRVYSGALNKYVKYLKSKMASSSK